MNWILGVVLVMTGVSHANPEMQTTGRNRPQWLDPCTLPEFPGEPLWSQGRHGYTYPSPRGVALNGRDTAPITFNTAEGICGFKSGDRVRLRIDLQGSEGQDFQYPVAIRIELTPEVGHLSHAGEGESCSRINLLWNRRDASGRFVPNDTDFDLTVGGSPDLVTLEPDPKTPGAVVPLWRDSSELRITVGEIREAEGMTTQEGDLPFKIRPVGTFTRPPMDLRLDLPAPVHPGEGEVVIVDPEARYTEFVKVLEPHQFLVVLQDSREHRVILPIYLSTFAQGGHPLSCNVPVLVLQESNSQTFLGRFMAVPEGYSGKDIEKARAAGDPIVVIGLGSGTILVHRTPNEVPACDGSKAKPDERN